MPGQAGIDARLLLAAPMKLLGMTCSEVLSMEAVDFPELLPESVPFPWEPTPFEWGDYSDDLVMGDGSLSKEV